MPGKILGIDISSSCISAVQVISGLKGYQAISCFSEPVADNNPLNALEKLAEHSDLKSDRCFLSIPPAGISFRNIETPFKEAKKIRQTLPFEIESHVPFSVEGMVIDYIHSDADNPAALLTALAGRTLVSDYIELLQKAGLDPDIIDIRPLPVVTWLLDQEKIPADGIYLDLELEHPCLVIFKGKRIAVIRELSGSRYIPDPDKSGPGPESVEELIKAVCAETLKTLHSYNTRTRGNFRPETIYFGGRLSAYRDAQALISSLVNAPCERVNIVKDGKLRMDINLSPVYDPPLMESALALALREARKSSGFNFRRGEFKAGKSVLGQIKHVKTTIIMLAVLLCMLIVNAGTDYYFVSKRHSQMISEFDKIAPEFSGIKNARGKITAASQKLRSLNNPSSDLSNDINPAQRVLDIIRDLSVRINEQYSFDISTLIINSREVTIKANYDSYDTSKLERALKSSDLYKNVIITSNRKGEGVILDVKLERAD